MFYSSSPLTGPLRQCEIITGLRRYPLSIQSVGSEGAQAPTVNEILHPIAVILSQDCDLELDFKAQHGLDGVRPDKLLQNILLCDAVTEVEAFRPGEGTNAGIKKDIVQNKHERYHFLRNVESSEDTANEGLAALVIDFKRYFTIPTLELYKRLTIHANRRCYLNSPYLEHLSTRFAYYQMRVALPQDHQLPSGSATAHAPISGTASVIGATTPSQTPTQLLDLPTSNRSIEGPERINPS